RRHTRFSRDWSSDVCSSDLLRAARAGRRAALPLVLQSEPQHLQPDRHRDAGRVGHQERHPDCGICQPEACSRTQHHGRCTRRGGSAFPPNPDDDVLDHSGHPPDCCCARRWGGKPQADGHRRHRRPRRRNDVHAVRHPGHVYLFDVPKGATDSGPEWRRVWSGRRGRNHSARHARGGWMMIARTLSILFVGVWMVGAAVAQPELSLSEAIRLARENNYAIRIADNDVRMAENDYSIGNAGFLPTLSLNANQSRRAFGNFSDDGGSFATASTVDLSMDLSTTIFDGGGRFATYRRLGSELELIERSAERTMASVLADVVVAYYDLVRRQQQLEVLRDAVEVSEERHRIAELRRDLGSASELEVRRARVDLNADRAELLRQEVELANAKASFKRLLARDGDFDFTV